MSVEVIGMGKSSSEQVVDHEPLFRVESIPPPDGEDIHDSETKLGDWALAVEEKRRASAAVQATAKVNAFDLEAAIAKTKATSIAPPAPLQAEATPPMCDDLDDLLVVQEVTIDVQEGSSLRAQGSPPPRTARRSTATLVRGFLEALLAVAFILASALILSR